MALPTMTPEQRADALVKATEARQARSALLAQVKSGALTLKQLFERTDDEIVKKTRVQQVLRALPGYGPAKVAALMTDSGVDEKRRVGGLTGAQRERLLEAVTPSGADGRASDTSHHRGEPTPPGQDLRQALQEQLGQVFQPAFDESQHQFADAVRHQLEQALHPTGEESEGELDAVAQPPHRPGRDQTEQTPPQPGGPTEENGRQLEAAEQDEAAPRSAGILG